MKSNDFLFKWTFSIAFESSKESTKNEKLFQIFRHITDSESVKTVVEGGATIQVTSHDISDTDEEDGNVYNVKVSLHLYYLPNNLHGPYLCDLVASSCG